MVSDYVPKFIIIVTELHKLHLQIKILELPMMKVAKATMDLMMTVQMKMKIMMMITMMEKTMMMMMKMMTVIVLPHQVQQPPLHPQPPPPQLLLKDLLITTIAILIRNMSTNYLKKPKNLSKKVTENG